MLSTDGPLLIALDTARRMLAACDQWSAIAGGEASIDRIHYDALPPPSPGPHYTRSQMIAVRPFALLWSDTAAGYQIDSGTTTADSPNQSGRVICQIELNVPAEHATKPHAVATWANRTIGRLVRTGSPAAPGLWDLSRNPGSLPIRQIDVAAYERTTTKESIDLGDAIIFELALHWSTK